MAKALTSKTVENILPGTKRREIPDPALTGLYLVVQPSGKKSWAVRYRHGGKPRKLTLGKWPVMGVQEARAEASQAINAVEHGNDPGKAKQRAKAERLDALLSERDKVKVLIEQYAQRHLATLKSGATAKRELERHAVSAWGERNVQEISRRDIIDLLDAIGDSGRVVTANRVRAYLNTFFNWCVERDVLSANPATGVKSVAKEKSRSRVLSADEVRWFWAACDALGQPWGALGKLLLLTGQRLGEVVGMTETEIEGNAWFLSAERTKNGRAHQVPLSDAALRVLDGMARVGGNSGLLHTTTGETPLSGFHKARGAIAEKMIEIASNEAGEPVDIPHWTFHDLRRTVATGMARLGIPVRVTEAVLNHVSGTGGGIVAVYQVHDYADEKRQALEAWGAMVCYPK